MDNVMEKANRNLELYGEINSESANKLISELRAIVDEDINIIEENETKLDKYKQPLEPVEIYFNSPGGSIIDGCAILSVIEEIEAPILGHIIGECSSMASYIFLACDIRTGTRFSQIGIHGAGIHGRGMTGYVKEIDSMNQGINKLMKVLNDDILLKRTKLSKKELEKTQTCLRFFGYDECVKYNFFTHDIYDEKMMTNIFD